MQDQDPALIRSLQNAALYPHPVQAFRLFETHISWVLLTGPYAYKIKKAVDFGFLDFSTLEKRRHYCAEELRLNRRLAPALYLEVVAIGGSVAAPRLCVGDEEPALEYAVKMVQFAPDEQFDRLLAAGALTADQLRALARVLARFHAESGRASPDSPYGTVAAIAAPARENFAHIRLPAACAGAARTLDELATWSERRHATLAARFEQRRQAGFVRECHGDLHLANITLHEGRPTPFDCLEFDPQLRWIDVVNEIAFLTMDLDARGRRDLSLLFLNEYLHHSGDYEGLALLRYYQVYRAMVRAKIECLRLAQRVQDGGQNGARHDAGAYAAVLAYIELAGTYVRPPPRALIISHGFSGSGKTTMSEELLAPCGLIRIRSDVERKRLAGYAPEERSHSPSGGGIYTRDVGERTYRRLQDLAAAVIDAGFPVLVDATFLQRAQRERFRALADHLQVPFLILDFQAPEAVLRARVSARRPGSDASEAGIEVLMKQLASHEPIGDDERERVLMIDTTAAAHMPGDENGDTNGDAASLAARILMHIEAAPA